MSALSLPAARAASAGRRRGGGSGARARRTVASARAWDRFGMFSRAGLEAAYLQSRGPEIRARLRGLGLWGGLVFALASLLDRALAIEATQWPLVLTVRLFVFACGLALATIAGPRGSRRMRTLCHALTGFELAVCVGAAMLTLGQHGMLPLRVVSWLAITLCLYAYMPRVAALHTGLLPGAGALYLLELALVFRPSWQALGVVALLFALANAIGRKLAVRDSRARRADWLVRRRLRVEMRQRRAAEKNLRKVLEACPVPLVVNEAASGEVLMLNRAARGLFNPARREVSWHGVQVGSLFRRRRELGRVLDGLRHGGVVSASDVRLRTVDDEPVDVMLAARCLRYDGRGAVLSSLVEMTARKEYERALRRQSRTDALTGLPNRRGFFDAVDSLARSPARYPVALLLMDVDHFKRVNDTHGHEVGDLVLQMFAGRVRAMLRRRDLVARVGGEEFAVLLPSTGIDEAWALAERIRAAVGRHAMRIRASRLPVTVSIGVTEIDAGHGGIDRAMARADAAMYRAKAAGRDRVQAHAPP